MEEIEALGEVIRVFRKRRGWTQKELGLAARVSSDLVSRLERAKVKKPWRASYAAIARALELKYSEFERNCEEVITIALRRKADSEYDLGVGARRSGDEVREVSERLESFLGRCEEISSAKPVSAGREPGPSSR